MTEEKIMTSTSTRIVIAAAQKEPHFLDGAEIGFLVNLAPAQLAILPGTTHVTLVDHPDWLLLITAFIAARTEAL